MFLLFCGVMIFFDFFSIGFSKLECVSLVAINAKIGQKSNFEAVCNITCEESAADSITEE